MTGKPTNLARSIGALATLAACSTGVVAGPPRPLGLEEKPVVLPGPASAVLAPAPLAEESFYRPVDALVRANVRAAELPLSDVRFARDGGAAGRWTQAPPELRDGVRRNGFGVLVGLPRERLGEYYAGLRDAHVPFVITLDTLAWLAHVAVSRMFADAERLSVVPALYTELARMSSRLEAARKAVTTDLGPAYAVARGLVAVARALAEPEYAPPTDLAVAVAEDVQRVLAHRGPAVSAVLGVSIDFAQLAPRAAMGTDVASARSFRALGWLAHAPLMLLAHAEAPEAPLDVFQARAHTRAALLFSRLVLADLDTQGALAFDRVARPLALLDGPPDDLSPRAFAAMAAKAGLDVRDPLAIQNVVRVDRVRHSVERAPRVYDGAGGLVLSPSESSAFARGAVGIRIFGPAATADSVALSALVAPALAARSMPAALDVAAWLGSVEARALAREGVTDGAAYDAAQTALETQLASFEERHGSVFATGLEALRAFLAPSAADGALPAASSRAWRRRKIEASLSAWTALRHDSFALARRSESPAPAPGRPSGPATPMAEGAFVEPHPEAIAELVAMVEQASRGLVALGTAHEAPGAGSVAGDALSALRACLVIALREANDEASSPAEARALADVPALLLDLESRLGPTGEADVSLVADVHADAGSAHVLEEATGAIDDMFLVLREPVTGRLVLALGASIAHHELLQPASLRLDDDEWRARLRTGPLPRAPYTRAFLVGGAE